MSPSPGPDVTPGPLPWQARQWQRLAAMEAAGRLAHALLLRGPAGTGKRRFAEALAARLLCDASDATARPCGRCRSCHLAAAGTHPDLHRVLPEEDRRQIGIDQVRDLIAQVGLTPHFGRRKLVVVHPAELMTRAAANTLLKTLEEPPGDGVFLLVAHTSSRLPATIRSRCQIVDFPLPGAEQALPWLGAHLPAGEDPERVLRLVHGAPLLAPALAEKGGLETREAVLEDLLALVARDGDPVATAARWEKRGPSAVLAWLDSVICDLIRLKNGRTAHRLTHSDRAPALHDLARRLDLGALFHLLDLVADASRTVTGGPSLNEHLLLERITIAWGRSATG